MGDGVDALAARRPGHGAGELGGGYAEYCAAPAPQVLPVPAGLVAWSRPAAMPETFFTVWTNVFDRGRLQPGESFLVHGGSSRHRHHRDPAGPRLRRHRLRHRRQRRTSGAPARSWGPKRAIDYRNEDFVEVVRAETGGKGVDVILDMVGGALCRAQPAGAGRRGPAGADRLAAGPEGPGQLHAADAQAADLDRLDPAAALGRAEGRDRPGAGGQGLAAAGRGQGQAADPRDLPAATRQRRPTR